MDLNTSYKLELSNYNALQTKMNNMRNENISGSTKFSIENNDRKLELEKLKTVSDDFESLLINEMIKSMRKTVNKTGLIDGGMTEDIFGDMLYTEYSKSFSKSKSFGISEMIYKQMEVYI